MPDVTVDIHVYCGECGDGLCMQSSGGDSRITVDPCEKCLEHAKEEAKQEGYDDGYSTAQEEAA